MKRELFELSRRFFYFFWCRCFLCLIVRACAMLLPRVLCSTNVLWILCAMLILTWGQLCLRLIMLLCQQWSNELEDVFSKNCFFFLHWRNFLFEAFLDSNYFYTDLLGLFLLALLDLLTIFWVMNLLLI